MAKLAAKPNCTKKDVKMNGNTATLDIAWSTYAMQGTATFSGNSAYLATLQCRWAPALMQRSSTPPPNPNGLETASRVNTPCESGEIKPRIIVFQTSIVSLRASSAALAHTSSSPPQGRESGNAYPGPAMPGLSSTPFSVTPAPPASSGLPAPRCLAKTSHTGTPLCSLTEAHPATL